MIPKSLTCLPPPNLASPDVFDIICMFHHHFKLPALDVFFLPYITPRLSFSLSLLLTSLYHSLFIGLQLWYNFSFLPSSPHPPSKDFPFLLIICLPHKCCIMSSFVCGCLCILWDLEMCLVLVLWSCSH